MAGFPFYLKRAAVPVGLLIAVLFASLAYRSRSGTDALSAYAQQTGEDGTVEQASWGLFAADGLIGLTRSHSRYQWTQEATPASRAYPDTLGWSRDDRGPHDLRNRPRGSLIRDWLSRVGFIWESISNPLHERKTMAVIGRSSHVTVTIPLWVIWMTALLPAVVALSRWSRRNSSGRRGFAVEKVNGAAPDAPQEASHPPA